MEGLWERGKLRRGRYKAKIAPRVSPRDTPVGIICLVLHIPACVSNLVAGMCMVPVVIGASRSLVYPVNPESGDRTVCFRSKAK